MIKTLIADDESHARERLRDLLGDFGQFDIVAEAADGDEALSLVIARKPDVAFLDINMPGVSVFTSIPSLRSPPLVVFQTAYSEHAADAFEIDALDYLLKPVRRERLERTVAKIRDRLASHAAMRGSGPESTARTGAHVTIKAGGKTKVVAAEEIIRISCADGFCHLYTKSGKLVSDKYLSHYEERLQGGRFFRTSRTDMVNLDHVAVIGRAFQGMHTIELDNGMQVDLSRRRARELRKLIDF